MRPSRKTSFRVLSELLIIVIGVLLAFQVEAWRERVDARIRERSQLLALNADFGDNAKRLREDIERQTVTVEAVAEILRIAYDDLPAPEAAELSRLFTSASLFQRFEPVTGAYDALVSSGDLGVLRSQELRSELAAFFGAVGKGYEDEAMADALHVQWTLMSVRRGPLLGMMTPEILSIIGYSGTRPPIDFHALLGDEEYLGLLAAVGVLEGLHLRYFHNLDTRVTEILKLLAQELTK